MGFEQKMAAAALKGVRGAVLTGMKRNKPHGIFINSDAMKLPYGNWNHGEPNDWGKGEECVELYTARRVFGKWNDIACRGAAALCEIPAKSYQLAYDGNKKHSYAQWQKICRKRGGELAQINNKK